MKRIRIVFIVICVCVCLTAASAHANGYHPSGAGCCSNACWALPLIFLGIPALAYALSGAFYREPAYVRPAYVYYEPSSGYDAPSYQRTYHTSRTVSAPAVPASSALQHTVDNPDRYRYYCRSPRGYYPDVMDCPLGWKKVLRVHAPLEPKTDK